MNPSLIRNIGIIAHIDAGKTTLTERILHHAGLIKRAGSVDNGDTVMDYMAQERARGITIKSAAITIPWRAHHINLIDTPGHVDFTMEVERAMRVMDGAVTVIDGSAGVQAQTMTVWQQANRFAVRRLIFVNKLDKAGADFGMAVRDIEARLKVTPVVLSEPVYSGDELIGVESLLHESHEKYAKLSERIAENDEEFLADYLDNQRQPVVKAVTALKRLFALGKFVPVFAGSAGKDIAVANVLDSVIDYLPAPEMISDSKQTKALAFKVVCDQQRGVMVYVRVYSGSITTKSVLFTTSGKKERPTKVMRAAGKDLDEVERVSAGDIAVLIGLKQTKTGDTLCDNQKFDPLDGVIVPPPVFQMACNANSKQEEELLDEAFRDLCMEDPSLQVQKDQNTGQLVMSGQGELHLEIVGQRLKEDYKIAGVDFGPIQIAYKETVTEPLKGELQYEKIIGSTRLSGLVALEIAPLSHLDRQFVSCKVEIVFPEEALRVSKPQHQEFIQAVKDGIEFGLLNGPIRYSQVTGVRVTVLKAHCIDASSSPTALRHATIQLLSDLMRSNAKKCKLLEPIMALSVECQTKHLGTILPDLHSNRRAFVHNFEGTEESAGSIQMIEAEAPLAELVGYAPWLRTVTSGTATLALDFKGYKPTN
mgnify:CR=1 FL=1